ncbi:hypothetical protein BD770DRAFT_153605 [Pilaira anomala]|nr:hypothetical protein BD770DRAFT_153605 [Pilaira anomala]
MQAMSDFLHLKMKKLLDDPEIMIDQLDAFHYMFVAPSEWDYKEREDFFRPIFVQSGLISKDDHKDRLLFLSDLEAIFYHFQRNDSFIKKEFFKRWQRSLMCRISATQYNNLSMKLDLIETQYSSFDIANSMFYPRVVYSTSFSVTSKDIKNNLKTFIEAKVDFHDVDIDQNKILQIMVNKIYNNIRDKMDGYDHKNVNQKYKELMVPWIIDTKEWGLDDNSQTKLNKPISVFDICAEIGSNILHDIRHILVDNIRKQCELLVINDQYSSDGDHDPCLFSWLCAILEYGRYSLEELISTTKTNAYFESLYSTDITKGAAMKVFEAIQNSDIHTNPCIIFQKDILSSNSIFLYEKANAVISIDISLKQTLLSYSLVDDDGLTTKIFDTDYFTANKCFPPLSAFYEISDGITLKVDQRFVSFVDENSSGGLDPALLLNDITFKKLQEIEDILNIDFLPDNNLIYTRQTHYIRAFLIAYLFYINALISNGILNNLNTDNTDIKIGYIISIEKLLLYYTFSGKKEFTKHIFESGIIRADDASKKLRIITQGEGLLPVIQNYTQLKFPIKTYFVLAQLHKDYVHLELNQVITCSSINEEEQESIILRDEIIHIQNIYDSLGVNMWNYIICNTSLIKFCNIHDGDDVHKFLDLFSLKARSTFLCSLEEYISDNVGDIKRDSLQTKK